MWKLDSSQQDTEIAELNKVRGLKLSEVPENSWSCLETEEQISIFKKLLFLLHYATN